MKPAGAQTLDLLPTRLKNADLVSTMTKSFFLRGFRSRAIRFWFLNQLET